MLLLFWIFTLRHLGDVWKQDGQRKMGCFRDVATRMFRTNGNRFGEMNQGALTGAAPKRQPQCSVTRHCAYLFCCVVRRQILI